MERTNERYIETVKLLNKVFDFFNEKQFNNELEQVVITVQTDEKSRVSGWFSVAKVWKENAEDKGAHEINITAQFLNRPLISTAETMLHEMCHLYASQKGLKDTSRSGIYHNKLFKEICENHGLDCESVQTFGWSYTTIKSDFRKVVEGFLNTLDESVIYRQAPCKGGKVKTSSTRKYVCPFCGASVRATKEVRIACVDCDELMVLDE